MLLITVYRWKTLHFSKIVWMFNSKCNRLTVTLFDRENVLDFECFLPEFHLIRKVNKKIFIWSIIFDQLEFSRYDKTQIFFNINFFYLHVEASQFDSETVISKKILLHLFIYSHYFWNEKKYYSCPMNIWKRDEKQKIK